MVGVIEQIRIARRNPASLTVGVLLGGFVPVATFWTKRCDFDANHPWSLSLVLILAVLVFSAKTVTQWASSAFRDTHKALGFVALMEGVMVTTPSLGMAFVALAYLVTINAVATGCILAQQDIKSAAAKSKKRAVAENDNARISGRIRKAA